jgi:hypothetical protein
MFEGSSYNNRIDWNDALKKKARGINDENWIKNHKKE